VIATVFAALALVIALLVTVLLADSTLLEFTARTAKYHVPVPSAVIVVLVAFGSLIDLLCDNAVALLPNSTLNPDRFVSALLSVFVVGAVQDTVAEPPPQLQVSVYDWLDVIAASVSLPEANLVPLHPPLARQLVATGVVDQVNTGTRLPVAEVCFAVKVTVPAVCACAAAPNNSSGSARSAYLNLCI
jgi:hypothetical protein